MEAKTMKTTTNAKLIEILVRSRYPLVWVQTYEEGRVLEAIESVARERKLGFEPWSLTKGFEAAGDSQNKDPHGALAHIEKFKDKEAIYVLKDFHAFVKDAKIARQLRDLDSELRKRKSTIVVLSPHPLQVPDLEKSFYVMDWSLPSREEVREKAENLLKLPSVKRPENLDAAVDAAMGLTLTEVQTTFAKSAVTTGTLDVSAIISEKKQILKKGGILEFFEVDGGMGDVGGHEVLKDWLRKRKRAFTPEAREFGLDLPKGMLLVGPPGSGKSLVAKITGNHWGMATVRLDVGRIFQGLVGSSEENMRKAIAQAEACAPCILWVDEIEKGFGSGGLDGGTSSRVLGTFLTWMQEHTTPVFVLATANDVSALPPELLRKGRFDEIWFSDLPTEMERGSIFEIHLKKKGRKLTGDDICVLAEESEGFTGAEIEQAVKSALFDAFDAGRNLQLEDVRRALKDTAPVSKTMKEKIDALREWVKGRARSTSSTPATPRGSVEIIDLT
jgi:SpoVK/Ycf46/Vps4 family AAA+-type ATPase